MNFGSLDPKRQQVLLTSADIAAVLQKLSERNIVIRKIERIDAFHIRFYINKTECEQLRIICENRGDTIELLRHSGKMPILFFLRKRYILVIGVLLICMLSFLLPTRILFVRVEGNRSVPTRLILAKAEQCGIHWGISSRQIRSDQLKNGLLTLIPQLQWAGINTIGCTAVISVREGSAPVQKPETIGTHYMIAAHNAVIRQVTVLEGNSQCMVGDHVTEGQILVSPFTDCGLCIRVSNVKAEIYGDTERALTTIFPVEYQRRAQITDRHKKISLIIGKKRINFYKGSGISGSTCAKIYEEKYMTLPGGFVLPLGIIFEEFVVSDDQTVKLEPAPSSLKAAVENYLLTTMCGGAIIQADHIISNVSQICRIDSAFQCYEMIGLLLPEEDVTKDE